MLARRSQDELAQLHDELVRCRAVLAAAREIMIEALGDWMCGSSGGPPSEQQIEALATLSLASERAEEAYRSCARRLAKPVPIRMTRKSSPARSPPPARSTR